MSERYRIALLPGDGIGPEVTTATEWVGKNLGNPLTLLGSAVLMLEHLGEREAATRIDEAIARVLEERKRVTRDLGGSAAPWIWPRRSRKRSIGP